MASYEVPIIRILSGFRCMGYTPVAAFLDIIDNTIAAKLQKLKL